jgi:hypothetical protein
MPQRNRETGLTPARLALLRVYSAIDESTPRDDLPESARIPLADALRDVAGIDVGDLGTPTEMLQELAQRVAEERAEPRDPAPGEPLPPMLPLVRLTEAALDVRALPVPDDEFDAAAALVAGELADRTGSNWDGASQRVGDALRVQRALDGGRSRRDAWSEIQGAGGGDDLAAELRGVRDSRCDDDLVAHRNEYVAKVDTHFVIDRDGHDMDTLATACMPDNWRTCNDFFCSVTYLPDRSMAVTGAALGPLTHTSTTWRGVYEEKVMTCPEGAFPHTFLDFEWKRQDDERLVLTYRLAAGLEDACVLKIDQGHLMVTFVGNEITVQTRKLLLFDDRKRPPGGQTLGRYACRLGWLDYSIAQFTGCATTIPRPRDFVPPRAADHVDPIQAAQDRLDALVDRAERDLRRSGQQTAADLDECGRAVRHGTMSTDEHVGRLAASLAAHAARDGAGWFEGQVDFALASVDLAQALATRWRQTHA